MKIPHSKPFFDEADLDAVRAVLASRYVSNGRLADELGALFASYLGKRWGIATQSGTDALTMALKLLDLPGGSRIAVPAYVCSAPLDALAHADLTPVPIDIDRDTLAMSMQSAAAVDVDATIVAHLFGAQADLTGCDSENVIEDCAQTLGTKRGVCRVGSVGVLSVCSFYATKLLTTGHGGLVAGDDPDHKERAFELLVHDKRDKWETHDHFLMSDYNAALGISQFGKLSTFIAERRSLAAVYAEAASGQLADSCCYSRFLVIAEAGADALVSEFVAQGIEAKRPVFRPLYQYLGLDDMDYPNSKWAHDHIVSVPLYPGMPDEHIARITAFLKEHQHELRCWPSA